MTADVPASRGIYFYLSHARSPSTQVDHWIQKFFDDLCQEIAGIVPVDSPIDKGFADLRPGRDRDAAINRALGTAHTFVPLYTPEYVAGPLRERDAFQQRLHLAGLDSGFPHILPVLWAPIAGSRQTSDLELARELGADYPAYLENGLGPMSRLSEHASAYKSIVERLARRIVDTAHAGTLAPSAARKIPDSSPPASAVTPFVVAVIAPAVSHLPQSRSSRDCYGPQATQWRPFPNVHDIPIADYTASVVQSMMMPPRVLDFANGDPGFESAPGVILVDPWVLETADGRNLIGAAASRLRKWVTLVIVNDRTDPQFARRGVGLADEVVVLVAGRVRPQARKVIESATDFELEIVRIIGRNRRAFLNSDPP